MGGGGGVIFSGFWAFPTFLKEPIGRIFSGHRKNAHFRPPAHIFYLWVSRFDRWVPSKKWEKAQNPPQPFRSAGVLTECDTVFCRHTTVYIIRVYSHPGIDGVLELLAVFLRNSVFEPLDRISLCKNRRGRGREEGKKKKQIE